MPDAWSLIGVTLKCNQGEISDNQPYAKEARFILSAVGSSESQLSVPLNRCRDFMGVYWHAERISMDNIGSELTLVIQTETRDDIASGHVEAHELKASHETGKEIEVQLAAEVSGIWTLSMNVQRDDGQDMPFSDSNLTNTGPAETHLTGMTVQDFMITPLLSMAQQTYRSAVLSRDINQLNHSINLLEQLAQMVPESNPKLRQILGELATALGVRGNLVIHGAIDDMRKSAACYQRVLRILPESDQEGLQRTLQLLGHLSMGLCQKTGSLDDIDSALNILQQLSEVRWAGPKAKQAAQHALNGLGTCFNIRFGVTGDMKDSERGIEYLEKAISLVGPEESAEYWPAVVHLVNALITRHERAGHIEDINRAIELSRKAGSSPQITSKPLLFLTLSNNLTAALYKRYLHSDNIGDLEEAISVQQRCVRDSAEDPGLASRLTNLSSLLETRYQRLHNVQDVHEAIRLQLQALDLTAEGDAVLPGRLLNLALAYLALHQAIGQTSPLQDCINHIKRSMVLIPSTHPHFPLILFNLGIALTYRATSADVEEAIQIFTRAIALTPEGHRATADRWNSLGQAWHSKFKKTQNQDDLGKAISAFERAVSATPDGHGSSAIRLSRVAGLYAKRYVVSKAKGDLETALQNWRKAVSSSTSRPFDRFNAATSWARSECPDPLIAWDAAIELIPLLVGVGETVMKRTVTLSKISDVALEAASAAFAAERPDKALQWLEQARSIIWSQVHALKSPIDKLRTHNPELADRLSALSTKLQSAGFRKEDKVAVARTMNEKISTQDETVEHQLLARQWDELLAEIRKIPELEYILLSPPTSQLFEHLPSGTVVVLNVSKTRCDAVALLPGLDEPMHIPLPLLSEALVEDMATRLKTKLSELSRSTPNTKPRGKGESRDIETILRQLWTHAVKPIIDWLGFAPSKSPESRIWWCTTGSLSFLPIHAAGIYSGPDAVQGETTLQDYAISSYTPTVAALANRVKASRNATPSKSRFLLVSQPKAPGLPSIPCTSAEVETVHEQIRHFFVDTVVLEGAKATVETCLNELVDSSCVHLACHAIQDPRNPMTSGFFMQNGKLTLSTILQGKIENPNFAFLSACQTSTGDRRIPEESIHIAAGMLAVGYRSVLGTMWSIHDDAAPKVAEEFYKHLAEGAARHSSETLDFAQAAEALHYSTRLLRQRLGTSDSAFLTWVPYVHYGL